MGEHFVLSSRLMEVILVQAPCIEAIDKGVPKAVFGLE